MELEHARIAQRIKQARLEAGLKQREMADLLGVIQRTYQNYESEKAPRIPWDRMNDIARITGTKVEWLLHGDTPDVMGGLTDDQLDRIEALLVEVRNLLTEDEGGTAAHRQPA